MLAKFWQSRQYQDMGTMNISLPDSLKSFVDSQVSDGGYGTSSEYVRELIRKDLDRRRLRDLLMRGARSKPGPAADASYFEALRHRVRAHRGT
jgi:antitoxin ParD1/3/4